MQGNGNQPSDKAQAAYAVAEQMIAEALASGAEELDFFTPSTSALTKIPPEISKLTDLTSLDLRNTYVSDISALKGITRLTSLDLRNTSVSDISVLMGITGMTRLDLGDTYVSDISALKGMTGMTLLNLKRTQVSDISALKGMTRLTSLNLKGTQVIDLAPIATLTSLIPYADASPLEGLFYSNTPATARDAVLQELSQIKDDRMRTAWTLAYLRGGCCKIVLPVD